MLIFIYIFYYYTVISLKTWFSCYKFENKSRKELFTLYTVYDRMNVDWRTFVKMIAIKKK